MVEFSGSGDSADSLSWDATYEIVLAIMRRHPELDVEQVGVAQLKALVLALPGFEDDPRLANAHLLNDILREWYEESQADYWEGLR